MIKAEVADPESRGSMIYAFVLIVVNVLFFISIWWDMWLSIKASLCAGSFQVRPGICYFLRQVLFPNLPK